MTTSSGTGRPSSARDGRVEVDRPDSAPAGPPPEPGNGGHSATKASTAYEVAAALRAQASRAAQATKDAANRVQNAVTTPEQDVQTKTSMPARSGPDAASGQQPSSGGSDSVVTGAAAAVAATAPARDHGAQPAARQPAAPPPAPQRGAQPARQPAPAQPQPTREPAPAQPQHRGQPPSQPAAHPSAQPGTAQPVAQATYPQAPERPHPAPGEQGPPSRPVDVRDAPHRAQASAPPAPPVAPPAAVPPTPAVEPDDTQVSLDARPQTPPAPPVPPRTQRQTAPARRTTRVRKARLRLMRLDPWSVMKTAFLLSVALGIALFVAVAVLWSVLDAAGVFTAVGDLVRDLTQSDTSGGVDIENYTALSRVLGFTTLIAVVDVVLVTALATLGAFLYNLSASLLGGLEVTLAEDD